jgi:hypothetical protein
LQQELRISMRHAEWQMGLVWNINNVGKTSQSLFHLLFIPCLFMGYSVKVSVLYPFKRQIKSHLPFPSITRRCNYSSH